MADSIAKQAVKVPVKIEKKPKQLSGKYAEIKKNEPLIRVARF